MPEPSGSDDQRDDAQAPAGSSEANFEFGSRVIIQVMAILLIIGGTTAMAFAVSADGGVLARYAFVAIPVVCFGIGALAQRSKSLPGTGRALVAITLFLIPAAAVQSSAGKEGLHSFGVFAILAVLTALDVRLVLGARARLVAVGLIMLVGFTVFHSQVYDTLSFGALYLIAAFYALLMGVDFVQRLGQSRHTTPTAGLLSTAGVLTYATFFALFCVLIRDAHGMPGKKALLAPVALMLSAPGVFHGSFLYRRLPPESPGRLGGAIMAFVCLISSFLSLVLTLLQGWPLFLWSAILTPLCLVAAYVFRVQWAHLVAALVFVVLYVTAVFLHAAPVGDYPWNHLALDVLAMRCLPLPYLLAVAGLFLERRGSAAGGRYLAAAVVVATFQVVLAVSVSKFGLLAAVVAGGIAPVALAIGLHRRERVLIATAGGLLYLAAASWVHGHGLPVPAYGLVTGLLSLTLLVCAIIGGSRFVERPLLLTSLVGAAAAILLAVGSLEAHWWHTVTGLAAALVLGMGGWRASSPGLLRVGFSVLLAVLAEARLRSVTISADEVLSSIDVRVALAIAAALLVGVSAFLRRTARLDTIAATPARQVALGAALLVALAVTDVTRPDVAGFSALLGAGIFVLAAVACRRPTLLHWAVLFGTLGGTQLCLAWGDWPSDPIERVHVALAALAILALVLRVAGWIASRWPEPGDPLASLAIELSRAAGGLLASAVVLAGVAFLSCSVQIVWESNYAIPISVQVGVSVALAVATLGLAVPRPLAFAPPRGALVIAGIYLLAMWSGVFVAFEETRSLVTYWQVMACSLSVLMAFGIGVRLPGVVPVTLVTILPALIFAFFPPIELFSAIAVLIAGMTYLRGAASLESQFIYYIGSMTATTGALMFVHELLPPGIPAPARSVVVGATANILAVWWTVCATRGWVRPVRFVRAALDSGVLCSLISAVALIAYLLAVVGGWTATVKVAAPPFAIRLAAIGVAISLVAYYVGAAAAFKSEFMVYVAELAFFGAATLTRFGFRDLFTDEQIRQALPYIIMALGFAFTGIAEFLGRKGLGMFSRPLANTGIFLPLISLLAMWNAMTAASFDAKSTNAPLIVMSASAFYFLATWLRRNRALTLLAAVFFNLAVWFVYDQFNMNFRDLPQLLAVPVGLAIILASQVMRDDIGNRASSSLRYLGLLVIYVSSAYQMFARAELLHSIIMAVLAVIGVFIGMRLKVRAFVYLGILFLVFTVVAQIVNPHPDLRWAFFAVVLGLVLFAVSAVKERSDIRKQPDETDSPAAGGGAQE